MINRVLLVIAAIFSFTARGQEPSLITYHNRGTVTNQVVFADIFINDGHFEVQNLVQSLVTAAVIQDVSTTPWDISNNRWFTNNGTFQGLSARFDYVDDFAVRQPLEAWVNTFNARMDLADGFHFGNLILEQQTIDGQFWYAPFSNLRIDSKLIQNQGLIRVGAGGLMRVGHTNSVTGELTAELIDLKDGILAIDPVGLTYGTPALLGIAEGYVTTTSYLNPLGIYDIYWGVGTFTNQVLNQLLTSVNPNVVTTPEHDVQDEGGFTLTTAWQLQNAQSWGFSFPKTDGTNIIIQAVFVEVPDTNIVVDVRWAPLVEYPTRFVSDANTFWTAFVEFRAVLTNALTLQPELSYLYVWDQLGGMTNTTLINNDKYPFFRRPDNYFMSRSQPFDFTFGALSNTAVTPSLFYTTAFSNLVTTNFYSGYAFSLENLVYRVPLLPGAGVRDLPGRVEIRGQNVDLTRTGIRGEGLISINASNLLSTVGTVVDSQNLAFNLATTSTNVLRVENLAKPSVSRLHGDIRMWSGTWTNQVGDANSNVFNLLYHVFVIDGRQLSTVQPVSVIDFQARSETVNIMDSMIVSNSFSSSARNLTISGDVELRNVAWGSTNLPNLRNLTIDTGGTLALQGLADFGTAGAPLESYINRGTVASYSQSIVATNVEISGANISGQNFFGFIFDPFGNLILTNFFTTNSGPLYVEARQSGRLEGGMFGTYGDITLAGPVFKLNNFDINSGATINLNVTQALQDSGPAADNVFRASNSFALNLPVPVGNLLGTTVHADPPPRGTFRFRWANTVPDTTITNIPTAANWSSETNRVFSAVNSVTPIGELQLHSTTNAIFEFRGTAQNRAVFIDLIVIDGTGITNLNTLTNSIRIIRDASTSMDVYYADIVATNLTLNLGFQSLAEFFNNRLMAGGGRFHWVPSFNGPNTSEDVVSGPPGNRVTVQMNRALRHSLIIDMDGDGIANGNDDLPLRNEVGPIAIANITVTMVNGQVAVQFPAYAGTYTLQYSESLSGQVEWKTANSYQHTGSVATMKTLADPTPTPGNRFYRLLYMQ